MELRSVRDWYGGKSPLEEAGFTRAVKTTTPMAAILARATKIDDGNGDRYQINDRLLLRGGMLVVHASPAPKDEYGEKAQNIVRFCVSSGEPARDVHGLDIAGLNKRSWVRNPIVPWCHLYEEPPVGRGRYIATVKRAGGTLELWSDVEFMPKDLYPFGHLVGRMYADAWLAGISLGWIPNEVSEVRSRTGKLLRLISRSSEMIEESACPIPKDRWALAAAASQGVLGTGTERAANVELVGRMFERTFGWRSFGEGLVYDVTDPAVRRAMLADVSKGADELTVEARAALTASRDALMRAYEPDAERTVVEEEHIDPTANLGDLSMLSWRGDGVTRSEGGGDSGDEGGGAVPSTEGLGGGPAGEGDVAPAPVADPPADAPGGGGVEDPASTAAATDPAAEGAPAAPVQAALPGELLRGEISDELDLSCDRMRGAIVTLGDAYEQLWSLCHLAYWQSRSLSDVVKVRQGLYEDPESPDSLMQMAMRQTKRLRAAGQIVVDAATAVDDAVMGVSTVGQLEAASLRDVLHLAIARMADEGIEIRAGKKISGGRRQDIQSLLDDTQRVAVGLQKLLDTPEKDREPEDAGEGGGEPEAIAAAFSPELKGRLDRVLQRSQGPAAPASPAQPTAAERLVRASGGAAPQSAPKPTGKRSNAGPGARVPERKGPHLNEEVAGQLLARMQAALGPTAPAK